MNATEAALGAPPPPCICCGAALAPDPRIGRRFVFTLPEGYSPTVWHCRACGYRRLWPALAEADYEAIYQRDYFSIEEGGDASGENFEASRPDRLRFYDERLARIRRLRPGRLRVVDVGAAEGDFLSRCDPSWDRLGIEYSQHGVDAARREYGIQLRKDSASGIAALGERFDLIHLHHVLEHLVDPIDFLQRSWRCLDSGGIFACEVPYQFGALTELAWAAVGRPVVMRGLWAVHHPHFFTPLSLQRLLVAAGYECISLTTCPRGRRRLLTDRWLKAALRLPLYALQRAIARGPVIEAICRKPR